MPQHTASSPHPFADPPPRPSRAAAPVDAFALQLESNDDFLLTSNPFGGGGGGGAGAGSAGAAGGAGGAPPGVDGDDNVGQDVAGDILADVGFDGPLPDSAGASASSSLPLTPATTAVAGYNPFDTDRILGQSDPNELPDIQRSALEPPTVERVATSAPLPASEFNPFYTETGGPPPPPKPDHMRVESDAAAGAGAPSAGGGQETAMLRQQVNMLLAERSELEGRIRVYEENQWACMEPRVILDALEARQPSGLLGVRGWAEKLAVLDEAIARGDCDLVTYVVLFLRNTLREDLFFTALRGRGLAFRLYETHCRTRGETRALVVLYRHFDMRHEEHILRARMAYASRNARTRMADLAETVRSARQHEETKDIAATLTAQVHLLDRQIKIENHDARVAASGQEAIYEAHPRPCIVFSPLSFTLHYNLIYHPRVSKEKLSSPRGMQAHFNVSDKMFMYLALKARAKVGDWETVKNLPPKKGVFKKSQQSVIGFRTFADVVRMHGGPRDLLVHFANLVETPEEKFSVAMRNEIYEVAVAALVELKDRDKLEQLRQFLTDNYGASRSAPLRDLIDSKLADKKIKWKKPKSAKKKK